MNEISTLQMIEPENENECQYEFSTDEINEELRQTGLDEEYVDYKKLAQDLILEVENVHAAYLFHSVAREALKQICLRISSTRQDHVNNTWEDLAAFLGLSTLEIGCIRNCHSPDVDHTELVLLTYCQRQESTLSHIVNAFETLKRYDALSIASQYFPKISEFVKSTHDDKKQICNEHSTNVEAEQMLQEKLKLLLPEGLPNLLSCQLPLPLREINVHYALTKIHGNIDKHDPVTEKILGKIEKLQLITDAPTSPRNKKPKTSEIGSKNKDKKRRYNKRVMLSFAQDGRDLAYCLAESFRQPRDIEFGGVVREFLPTGVLILDEHRDKVEQNPQRFITHQFSQMDFIIPILTEGYMEQLCNAMNPHLSNSLDERYIRYIHDLMSKYYTDNNCQNDKLRCVVPRQSSHQILSHQHFKLDPVFRIFCYDDNDEIKGLCERVAVAKRSHHFR